MKFNASSTPSLFYSKKFKDISTIKRPVSVVRNRKKLEKPLNLVIADLELMWEVKKIPQEVQQVYRTLLQVLPKSRAKDVFSKETEDLKRNQSLVQTVIKNIRAREKLIKGIIEMNDLVSQDPLWKNNDKLRSDCQELLESYRRLTLMTVESIYQWKQSLMNTVKLSGKDLEFEIDFKWKGFSYLEKAKKDISFIANTEFKTAFSLSRNPDPFLIMSGTLPSSMIQRIKSSERILFANTLQLDTYMNTKILTDIPSFINTLARKVFNRIAKEAVNQECNSVITEIIQDIFSMEIYDEMIISQLDWIGDMISIEKFDISNKEVSVFIYSDLLNEHIKNSITEILFIYKESQNLYDKLQEDIVKTESFYIANDLINEGKLNLNVAKIIQIAMIDLSVQFHVELEVISRVLTEELIDKYAISNSESELTELVNDCLSIEVLTPVGAIDLFPEGSSPNSYSISQSIKNLETPRSIFSDTLSYSDTFTMDTEFLIQNDMLRLVPLNIREKFLMQVLEEYYSMLNLSLKSICLPIDFLIEEALDGNDPSFFWIQVDSIITGLLIYSYHRSEIHIHHISSLNADNYTKTVQQTTNYLSQHSSHIVLYIYQHTPTKIKKQLTSLQFKWKASSRDLIHFGFDTSNAIEITRNQVKSICRLQILDKYIENKRTDYSFIGNRLCMLSAILSRMHDGEPECMNRLQEDLMELYQIFKHSEGFSLPELLKYCSSDILELNRFIRRTWNSSVPISPSLQSISVLDLNFDWKHCSHVMFNSRQYIQFRYPILKTNLDLEIFEVSLDLPNYKGIFIRYKNLLKELERESNNFQADLFFKIDNVLKGAQVSRNKVNELLVPAFHKKIEWEVSWITGLKIGDTIVSSCFEGMNVRINHASMSTGLLLNSDRPNVLEDQFVFGIIEHKVDILLNIPLLVCLIQKEDWINNI